MKLTPEQTQTVERWIQEGCGLSDIQKKLLAECAISMTYMDVRLLLIEMGLKVKDKASVSTVAKSVDKTTAEPAGDLLNEKGSALSRVKVDVDRVTRPGSVVSGTVRFSDGVTASWMLDQFGRLALDAGKKKYTPSEQDVAAFQEELRRVLERQGF